MGAQRSFQGNRLQKKNTRKAGHTGERWSVSHRWRTSVCAIEKKFTFTGQVCFHKSSIPSCTICLIEMIDAQVFKVTVKIK